MKRNNLKKLFCVLSALTLTLAGCSAQQKEKNAAEETAAAENAEVSASPETAEPEAEGKVLIAYFSRAGENYNVGVVEKGSTQILAEMMAEETGYDLFRIETVKEYPVSYDEMLKVSTEEKNSNERPELKTSVDNFDDYDTVLLGYPIWWADMPMAVYNFLESYDFSGKTVYPFDTHAGSGLAGTVGSISQTIPGADVKEGLAVAGTEVQNNPESARAAAVSWLKENGLIGE